MRNQPSALSQVCTNTAEKKQQLEDTGRGGKNMKIWKKGEQRGREGEEKRLERL